MITYGLFHQDEVYMKSGHDFTSRNFNHFVYDLWLFFSQWFLEFAVDLYTVWLCLRHRVSLSDVVGYSNPGLEQGLYFNKSQFSEKLLAAGYAAPQTLFLPRSWSHAERLARAEVFIAGKQLSYPLVVKPCSGNCGFGVRRIDDPSQLDREFHTGDEDRMLQEFCPHAVEIGVFYLRDPRTGHGRVVEINEKIIPTVTGDGSSSLRELIKHQDFQSTRHLLKANQHRLDLVPASGERIPLIFTRNYSAGGILQEVSGYDSVRLSRFFDEVSDALGGFYYGRYDILIPSRECLEDPTREHFIFLEGNGVGSALHSIYYPGVGLLGGITRQCAMVRELFSIIVNNRHRLPPLKEKYGWKLVWLNLRYHLRTFSSLRLFAFAFQTSTK